MDNVFICVPTYNRHTELKKLLDSILLLQVPLTLRVSLVIADNSMNFNSENILKRYRTSFSTIGIELHFFCIPSKGLSNVRNSLLDFSMEKSNYIIFVDDDEYVPSTWLKDFFSVLHFLNHEPDIILGAVTPVFEVEDSWLAKTNYYEQSFKVNNSAINYCASNNTLIKTSIIKKYNIRFDPKFNDLGGEDQDFFSTLIRFGARVYGTNDVFVYEFNPKDRIGLAWVVKREFRKGNTLGLISLDSRDISKVLLRVGSILNKFSGSIIFLFLTIFTGKKSFIKSIRLFFMSAGMTWGLLGYQYVAYPKIDSIN